MALIKTVEKELFACLVIQIRPEISRLLRGHTPEREREKEDGNALFTLHVAFSNM